MDIVLTETESQAVRKALDSYLSDLRMEIADTDNMEYVRELREERAALEGVLSKLDQARASSVDRDEAGRVVVRWVSVWAG